MWCTYKDGLINSTDRGLQWPQIKRWNSLMCIVPVPTGSTIHNRFKGPIIQGPIIHFEVSRPRRNTGTALVSTRCKTLLLGRFDTIQAMETVKKNFDLDFDLYFWQCTTRSCYRLQLCIPGFVSVSPAVFLLERGQSNWQTNKQTDGANRSIRRRLYAIQPARDK